MSFRYLYEKNGVGYFSEPQNDFSSLYLKVREREGRILTDREVKQLPQAHTSNPHFKEWRLRQKSLTRFSDYLSKSNALGNILDIGCGNGWFTHFIAKLLPRSSVLGIDINQSELFQASRVFNLRNLQYTYGDLFSINQFRNAFDLITVNASIQYFEDLSKLMHTLESFLTPSGEIHIIDSPFYDQHTVEEARTRTKKYYSSIGFPEMAAFYFHHCLEQLSSFDMLYRPQKRSIVQKVVGVKDSPFPWLRIKPV